MHARLWERDPADRGVPAPFAGVEQAGPLDVLSAEFPLRLTTVRRLDSTTPACRPAGTPRRCAGGGGALRRPLEDARALGVAEGETVRVVSRRGVVEAPVRIRQGRPRRGWPSSRRTSPSRSTINLITNEAWDPKSGTAEFKATAVRIEKLP